MTRSALLVLLVTLTVAAWASGAPAEELAISRLEVTLDEERLLVDLNAAGVFDQGFVERLESGLPTEVTYEFALMRDRKRWMDAPLAVSDLTVVAMHDAVNREYLVNFKLNGQLVDSKMVRTRAEVERAMTRLAQLPAFSLSDVLPQPGRLLVRARAVLGPRTILFFIPSRVTTDWVESKKFRPPAALLAPPS